MAEGNKIIDHMEVMNAIYIEGLMKVVSSYTTKEIEIKDTKEAD